VGLRDAVDARCVLPAGTFLPLALLPGTAFLLPLAEDLPDGLDFAGDLAGGLAGDLVFCGEVCALAGTAAPADGIVVAKDTIAAARMAIANASLLQTPTSLLFEPTYLL
jgi:hypothetical protein